MIPPCGSSTKLSVRRPSSKVIPLKFFLDIFVEDLFSFSFVSKQRRTSKVVGDVTKRGNGEQGTEKGEQGTEKGEQGTEKGEQGTENGERETGVKIYFTANFGEGVEKI